MVSPDVWIALAPVITGVGALAYRSIVCDTHMRDLERRLGCLEKQLFAGRIHLTEGGKTRE